MRFQFTLFFVSLLLLFDLCFTMLAMSESENLVYVCRDNNINNHQLYCSYGSSELELEEDLVNSNNYFSGEENMNEPQFWRLISTKLQDYIRAAHPSSEYELLKGRERFVNRDCDLKEGKLETNQLKNRYSDILPCDQTRVKLKAIQSTNNDVDHVVVDSDYINANYVGTNSEYIATQAPTPHSFHDFWQMVFQENSKVIVMLTKEYEGNTLKANRYWPDHPNSEKEYGNIIVSFKSQDIKFDYIIRYFSLRMKGTNEVHHLTHYQYLAWPDHGIPSNPNSLLRIIKDVQFITNDEDNKSPIVVHCSAGIGRTGAYIMIDSKLKNLQTFFDDQNYLNELPSISFIEYLKLLRKQRNGMISHKDQYLFCYDTVLTEALSRSSHSCSDG